MQIAALIIYLFFLAVYVFLIASIVWQIRMYLLPHDKARIVLDVFIIGAAMLIIVSLISFFIIPWKDLEEMSGSFNFEQLRFLN